MTRAAPPIVFDFLRQWETKVPFVYDDAIFPPVKYDPAAPAIGKLTGGYGHCGIEIAQWVGKDIPDPVIEGWLQSDVSVAARRFAMVVAPADLAQLTDNQYAALLSFVLDDGARGSWEIFALINKGKLDQVPAQLGRFIYRKLDGQEVPSKGLMKRRAAEVALFNHPVTINA